MAEKLHYIDPSDLSQALTTMCVFAENLKAGAEIHLDPDGEDSRAMAIGLMGQAMLNLMAAEYLTYIRDGMDDSDALQATLHGELDLSNLPAMTSFKIIAAIQKNFPDSKADPDSGEGENA